VRATCSVWLRSLALASVTAMCVAANAQQPGAAVSDEASAHRQGENTGEDFFRPPTNLFQAMTEYRDFVWNRKQWSHYQRHHRDAQFSV
jgi:hypothetical protein